MDDLPRTRSQKKSSLKDGRKKSQRRKQSPDKATPNACHSANGNLSWPRPSMGLRRNYRRSSSFSLVTCTDMEVTYNDNAVASQLDGNGNYDNRFPFQLLPVECQLKIISYLGQREKGKCAMVCRGWVALVRSPQLWTAVDLTDFSQMCSKQPHHALSRGSCHTCYRERVHQFVEFLLSVQPIVSKVLFQFDIIDPKDKWLDLFYRFIRQLNCSELKVVNLNWKDSPTNPYWQTDTGRQFTDVYRYRSRSFINMFEEFTEVARNVTTLILPFVWNARTVKSLTALKNLDILVIERYFFSQCIEQIWLTQLLSGLPRLRKLMLEIWTASASGHVTFSVASDSLEYLDISQSRGFYIKDARLPALKQLIISRAPWNGSLTTAVHHTSLPCLFDLLMSGGLPRLQKFNDLTLGDGWSDDKGRQLDLALQAVCSCNRHRHDWLA